MLLTISNQTPVTLILELDSHGKSETTHLISPYASTTTSAFAKCKAIRLRARSQNEANEKSLEAHGQLAFLIPLALGAKWKSLRLPQECPWRIYRSRITRGHHRLSVLPRRDLSSFLSEMPDSLPLSALVLPGTHDTMAFYGWPISQCQSSSTPLDVQLHSGIRALDVRLAVVNGRLIAYHGVFPQRTPFQDILRTVHDFLTAPTTRRETLVMSIKQEDFKRTPLPLFSQLVHDEMANGPGGMSMWFLQNRIPTLGEVRGRVILLSRFGGDGSGWEGGLEGLGIHPTAWPDSEKEGFTWTLKGTLVRTHDWYSIPSFLSIPEKTALATEILLPPPNNPPFPVLNVTFFSASSFPLAFPPTIAKGFGWPKWGFGIEGVNGRVGKWLLDKLSGDSVSSEEFRENTKAQGQLEDVRIRGWAFMDFYAEPEDGAVVPLLVECNFRGRRKGEEGWQ